MMGHTVKCNVEIQINVDIDFKITERSRFVRNIQRLTGRYQQKQSNLAPELDVHYVIAPTVIPQN